MATLSPNVQATVNAGLAVVFDGLSEVNVGELQEVLTDIQNQIAQYHPGNPASFQQFLTDGNALLQAIATDTGNPTVEKDAIWIGQIVTGIAQGKNVVSSIFASLFKKHSATPPVVNTPTVSAPGEVAPPPAA